MERDAFPASASVEENPDHKDMKPEHSGHLRLTVHTQCCKVDLVCYMKFTQNSLTCESGVTIPCKWSICCCQFKSRSPHAHICMHPHMDSEILLAFMMQTFPYD